MDGITKLIKEEIKRQYKSINKFSEVSGIPYSTLANALSRGIGTMSYDTVVKICNLLNLKQAYDKDLTIFNSEFYEICNMLEALDDRGVHTVKTVLMVEYERCANGGKGPNIKSYNGLAYASNTLNANTENHINSLIKKVSVKNGNS